MSAKKTTKKTAKRTARKTAKKAAKKANASSKLIPTRQQIEEAAYYCYLERRTKGLPDNSEGDWAQAISQLTA